MKHYGGPSDVGGSVRHEHDGGGHGERHAASGSQARPGGSRDDNVISHSSRQGTLPPA